MSRLLELKPMQAEHLHLVVELDQICLGGLWSYEGYRRELDSPNSTLLLLSKVDLACHATPETENLVGIGCFWSILEEAHITILGVHPQYRGRGLGQFLLCALLQKAMASGLERATLEVRQSNQVAQSLYAKFGFQVAGKRRGYYQNPQEDALILWQGGLNTTQFAQTLATHAQQGRDRLLTNHWHVQVQP